MEFDTSIKIGGISLFRTALTVITEDFFALVFLLVEPETKLNENQKSLHPVDRCCSSKALKTSVSAPLDKPMAQDDRDMRIL